MKYVMTLLCLLAVLGMAGDVSVKTDAGQPPEPDGQVRRFEIVSGITTALQDSQKESTMFRIDAFTGKTWVLRAMPMKLGNGQMMPLETWQELNETNGRMYEIAVQAILSK